MRMEKKWAKRKKIWATEDKLKKQERGRRVENEWDKVGGEWEERMVSFNIDNRIIKAVIACEPHLGETDSPICLSNLFIRFCLSPFRDLEWQCTMADLKKKKSIPRAIFQFTSHRNAFN